MRRLSAVALLVLGCLASTLPSAWGCSEQHHATAIGHAGKARAPYIVGDSTMIFAAPVLGSLGIEADARGCRQFSRGVEMLRSRERAGTLAPVAILALGANGSVGPRAITAALRVIGHQRVLGLVTPRNSESTRRNMRRAAERFSERVKLIDWAGHSVGHGDWFAGDGLHVNQTGARAFARFVRRAVAPLAFPPVRALRLPRHSTDAKACGSSRRAGRVYRVFVSRGRRRVTCERARGLVRLPLLRPIVRWRYYDWRRTGDGPWSAVYARNDRRVVVAAVPGR